VLDSLAASGPLPMTPHLLLFYLLAAVAVAAAVMVVSARNPVHSVLFLILTFFNAAGLFVLIGAEFLAMVLVVVYVGAVAVLFMFVVMMLNVNFVRMRQGALQYLPIGALVGIVLLVELVLIVGTWTLAPAVELADPMPAIDRVSNTEALGNLIYTEYFYIFQAAGVILLIAIIGAITLTLRERGDIRRQNISEQVHRDRNAAVALKKVKSRAGIS
jgi:NADH-quinone oxidoreductase subunit J